MSIEIDTIFKSTYVVVGLLIAGVAALLKTVKSIYEFNENILQRRFFHRLEYLETQAGKEVFLEDFLAQIKQEEIFFAIYGKKSSIDKAKSIISLYKSGLFTLSELQACHLYFEINQRNQLSIQVGKLGKAIYFFSMTLIFLMAIYTISVIGQLIQIESLQSFSLAVLVFLFFILFLRLIGREAIEVAVAMRCEKRLKKLQSTLNCENIKSEQEQTGT